MPIQHAIWKVGDEPAPLTVSKLATEKEIEDMIAARPEILSSEWMLIGRQEKTGFGGIRWSASKLCFRIGTRRRID